MSKSTITLLNGATIAPTNTDLLKFCQDVNALNDAGMLAEVFATIVKPEPVKQSTPRVRKPQARKSDPTMRMTVSPLSRAVTTVPPWKPISGSVN
jgi:hypothetical protein